jgi:NAD(P)-dependent dehydrogenase (short-subunit alcohol dehydrogenase family)
MKLENKVAIVTGGTSGIGFGVAKVLIQEGARVAIVGRNKQRGEEAVRELQHVTDQAGVLYLEADVSQVGDVQRAVEACVAQYGHIDILCNNAAVRKIHKVLDMPVEVWDEVLTTNLRGPFLFAKHALPHMKTGGSIINIGSVAGIAGYIGGAAYCSSKAGLVMLTKVLALESAERGIRANCIVCGAFPTPMFYQAGGIPEQVTVRIPLKRLGDVEEVGKAVAFLASEDCSYATGAVLVLDGGFTAGRS